jgi:hypothetical protein
MGIAYNPVSTLLLQVPRGGGHLSEETESLLQSPSLRTSCLAFVRAGLLFGLRALRVKLVTRVRRGVVQVFSVGDV